MDSKDKLLFVIDQLGIVKEDRLKYIVYILNHFERFGYTYEWIGDLASENYILDLQKLKSDGKVITNSDNIISIEKRDFTISLLKDFSRMNVISLRILSYLLFGVEIKQNMKPILKSFLNEYPDYSFILSTKSQKELLKDLILQLDRVSIGKLKSIVYILSSVMSFNYNFYSKNSSTSMIAPLTSHGLINDLRELEKDGVILIKDGMVESVEKRDIDSFIYDLRNVSKLSLILLSL